MAAILDITVLGPHELQSWVYFNTLLLNVYLNLEFTWFWFLFTFCNIIECVSWKFPPNACVIRKIVGCFSGYSHTTFGLPVPFCWWECRFFGFVHWARVMEWGCPPGTGLGESWLYKAWGLHSFFSLCSGPRAGNESPATELSFGRNAELLLSVQVRWALETQWGLVMGMGGRSF